MAVKTNQYASMTTQDPGRGPSMSIWKDCPIEDLMQDAGGGFKPGYFFQDDFTDSINFNSTTGPTRTILGRWTAQGNASAATATAIGPSADTTNLPLEGGVLGLKAANANKELVLGATNGGFGFLDASTTAGNFRGKMWFEASVAFSSVASAQQAFFIGLCGLTTDPTVTANKVFSTSQILDTTNSIFGFYKPGTDADGFTGSIATDFAVAYNVNAGTVQYPGAVGTLKKLSTNYGPGALTAATFTAGNFTTVSTMKIKLGWVFDPTPSALQKAATAAVTTNQTVGTTYKATLRFFVNGQEAGAFLVPADIQATTFPSKWMVPLFAQAAVSASAVAFVDWIRVAQLGTY